MVPVPQEGSLWGCSEEGSECPVWTCQSLGEAAIAPLREDEREVWVWAVQRAIWESRRCPGGVTLHLVRDIRGARGQSSGPR